MPVLPPPVWQTIERLEQAGFTAWVVGGCVRDSLRGQTPHDWDLTTDAQPEQMRAVFPQAKPTGLQIGRAHV